MNEQQIREFCELQYDINEKQIEINEDVIDKLEECANCLERVFRLLDIQQKINEKLKDRVDTLQEMVIELTNSKGD